MTSTIPGLDHNQIGGEWFPTRIGRKARQLPLPLDGMAADVREQPEPARVLALSLHPNTSQNQAQLSSNPEVLSHQPSSHPPGSSSRRWSDRSPLAFPSLELPPEPPKPTSMLGCKSKPAQAKDSGLHPNTSQDQQQQRACPGSWLEEKYIKRGGKLCGPYLYRRWRDESGRMRSKYLGKA